MVRFELLSRQLMPTHRRACSRRCILLVLGAALALSGCGRNPPRRSGTTIAVTNTYLQCAVAGLTGSAGDILCLTPPGMCPGHFDLSPGQVRQLAQCRLLFRFDFQKRIEESLSRMKGKGLKVISVRSAPGMCIPKNYLETCRDIQIALKEWGDVVGSESRLAVVERRLSELSDKIKSTVAETGLRGKSVLCSDHQAEFAGWLGLDVVATFVGSDIETVANLQQALEKAREKSIGFVIANRQEGTVLAEALAERLGAGVVVFSNFPDVQPGRNNFDAMVMDNLNALLEAGR